MAVTIATIGAKVTAALANSIVNGTYANSGNVAPAMQTNWSLLNDGVSSIRDGYAHVGLIMLKTTAWVNGDIATILPVGWRPLLQLPHPALQENGGTAGPALCMVDTSGNVSVYGQSGSNKQIRVNIIFPIV